MSEIKTGIRVASIIFGLLIIRFLVTIQFAHDDGWKKKDGTIIVFGPTAELTASHMSIGFVIWKVSFMVGWDRTENPGCVF